MAVDFVLSHQFVMPGFDPACASFCFIGGKGKADPGSRA
jgi:hypothetical protein